jgi:LysM repeat protein/soluble lytic murein transglycosylase-like protein
MHSPSVWQPSLPTMFKITVLGSALATLGLTGCASTQKTSSAKATQNNTAYLDATSLDGLEDLLSATDMRAVEGDRLLVLKHGDVWKRMTVGFKMNLDFKNSRIESQRGWFISRQPYLERLSARASRYLYYTVKEAERRGMPTELALLPVIESSYDPAATSSAAAAGLWQFIPSTGRIYGLKQNTGYDGRRDVVESTRAAYEFLGSLYNQFGSWELALAAYNAGPGRIQQAINRNKAAGLPTDYWSLKLPQETMNYVPRFLAVAQIVKNPAAYNVSLPPIANRPHFREVSVGAVPLNDIATITGLSRAELYQLNPGHRGERIDPQSPMRILIPADLSPVIDARLKKLQGDQSAAVLAGVQQNPTPIASTAVTITPSKTTPPTLVATTKTPITKPVDVAKPTVAAPTVATKANTTTKQATATTPVVTAQVSKRMSTPKGSTALAEFASKSDVPIPSAPRIPVAVTPVTPVKPIKVEPVISVKEREQLQAAIQAENKTVTVDEVLQPVATAAEQAAVIEELKIISPTGTEIVDPYDGKIKLTAIQTSQSVAEQRGQEVTKGFAYPKGLVDSIQANSVEARLNQGKNAVKTDTEVVVIAPKGLRTTYKVLPGDTLVTIAAKNGLNWRDVATWNQIDPTATLYVGTSIYLYDAKPIPEQSTKVADSKPETYVVQANDSLTSVANQFGLSLKQLAEYNGLNISSGLRVGQKLVLKETASSKAKVEESKKAEQIKVSTKVYTVQRGEYVKLIADRYALSNAELAALTPGLTASSSLMVGQKINVPLQDVVAANSSKVFEQKIEQAKVDRIPTEAYSVQRGETLYSLANSHKLTVTELAALNNLSDTAGLRVGQTIRVPVSKKTPEVYNVQSGDTLYGIAQRYDLKIDDLADLNGLSNQAGLRVGQQLKLSGEKTVVEPVKTVSTAKTDIHIVKAGETLSSIARQYRLQVVYLASLNQLNTNSAIRVGQQLKVEALPQNSVGESSKTSYTTSSKETESYTVKAGESLNLIASRHHMSAAELASLNKLRANAGLQVGQIIKVPKLVSEYKVRRGDTLIGVAQRHGIASSDLAKLNDLQPNAQLRVGEVIKVPN